jgi:hypothetical protein
MAKASARVLRSGSWNNNARNCQAGNRNRNEPDNRNHNYGFRLAAAPTRTDVPSEPAIFQPRLTNGQMIHPAPGISSDSELSGGFFVAGFQILLRFRGEAASIPRSCVPLPIGCPIPHPIEEARVMRLDRLAFFTVSIAAVLLLLALLPVIKPPLDHVITTVSVLSIINLLLQFAPLYCRCPFHGQAAFMVRWRHAGKWVRCRHCRGRLIQVPRAAFVQVGKQAFQRLVLRKAARDVALVCEPMQSNHR